MPVAIVSDIHANLEALEAVLQDIREVGATRILCLGDVVGYGPNPREVADTAMGFFVTVRGNHDLAVVRGKDDLFQPVVARGLAWTRERLYPKHPSTPRMIRRWRFLKDLPVAVRIGDLLLAHGSPTDPFEYVIDPGQAERIFRDNMRETRMCFLGHTHVPAIYADGNGGAALTLPEPDSWYRPRGRRLIVNVGSVGQPRDGDPSACYVLLREDMAFLYRRVPYDVETTARKIFRSRGLADAFGDRLYRGD